MRFSAWETTIRLSWVFELFTHVFMVGEPMRSYYMYDAIGVYQTEEDLRRYATMEGQKVGDIRYRDVNGDGIINDSDRTLVGKARPDFTWGLTNKFNYKRFDLTVTLTGHHNFFWFY